MQRDPVDAARRQKVDSICHAALDLPAEARAAYLRTAAGGDDTLRAEVEALLAQASNAEGFLSEGAGALAGRVFAASLTGTRFGSFDVGPLLGEGGMGQVYRARDTDLGRDVALKVLPPDIATDAEHLSRLEREARLLAALNHSNIAAIHGLARSAGHIALVLELVDGETLAAQIAHRRRGFDPVTTMRLGRQIADAVAAAHAQGIVHRDLKPANIAVRQDGTVKVLDFGIARRTPLARGTVGHTDTAAGFIAGTPGYWSPEQARGQPLDGRTDVWAFGCVLFEMLAGRRAFPGTTTSDAIAATLDGDPDWTLLPSTTPAPLVRLLQRCLVKDPSARIPDMAVARFLLDEAGKGPSVDAPVGRDAARRALAPWVIGGAAAVAAIATLAWISSRSNSVPAGRTELHAAIALDADVSLPRGFEMAISPDGATIVYVGQKDGRRQLYRRHLSAPTSTPIDAIVRRPATPFFSPDGQWLGFTDGNVLKKMPAEGGPLVTIAEVPSIAGASWGEDGYIVFGTQLETGLLRVSADGGTPEPLTTPSAADAGNDHRWPQVLPGGRGVIFAVGTGPEDTAKIVVLDSRTGERKDLVEGSASARYVRTGHLAYARNGALFVQRFDLERLELMGPASRLAEGVDEFTDGAPEYAFSDGGALVYAPGWPGLRDRLALLDPTGHATLTSFPPSGITHPRFSPDGRFIAVQVNAAKNNVWIHDVQRDASTRVTFGRYHAPTWSPAGRLVMSKGPPQRLQIVSRDPFGDGTEEPLTEVGTPSYAGGWMPDGRTLIFERFQRDTGFDIFMAPPGSPPRPVVTARGNQELPRVSPDGRWLSYISNEGGQQEVFVRALSGAPQQRQVSVGGGSDASWAPDSRRIYYRRQGEVGKGGPVWAVDLTTVPALSVGTPTRLFEADAYGVSFDVSPDGRHFAMVQRDLTPPSRVIHLVLNALAPSTQAR